MCTVSVIPPNGIRGLRVAVNRDERRTRSVAWAPQRIWRHGLPHIWPVDADAQGTWVAASAHGLVWAILNLNGGASLMPRASRVSRGHIIPALVAATDLDDVRGSFATLDLSPVDPFRLLVASDRQRTVFGWDGNRVTIDTRDLDAPEIWSSSSLGDHLVEGPRAQLFDELLARHRDPWDAQDHLHQHTWPDRRHLSVLMSRPLARTVSRTVVVMGSTSATMTYAPIVDGWVGPTISSTLSYIAAPLAKGA